MIPTILKILKILTILKILKIPTILKIPSPLTERAILGSSPS